MTLDTPLITRSETDRGTLMLTVAVEQQEKLKNPQLLSRTGVLFLQWPCCPRVVMKKCSIHILQHFSAVLF